MAGLVWIALAAAGEMLLSCEGGTITNGAAAGQFSDNTGYSAYGSMETSDRSYIPFHVDLRIVDGSAKMSVPSNAVQGARGDANWFPVSNLAMTDDEITGRVKFGFLRGSSQFRVDRRTGSITSSNGFNGQCRKVDLSERKF